MTAPDTTPKSLTDRLASQVRRDPKKVAILGVLLVVLLVLGIRETAKRVGPSSAEGATIPSRQGAGPARAGSSAAGLAKAGAGKTAASDGQDEDLSDLSKQAVTRDLFLVNAALFPLEEKVKPASPMPVVENPAAKHEAELRILQTQAKALTLQSTMVGAVPTAIINGQVLKAGEWISGFQVVEISARSCTIDKQGTRLILELAN